jgi:hypothetical protein
MSDPSAASEESREVRIGRILSEIHERKARCEPVNAPSILAAHPDLADELRPYLAVLREIRSTKDNIRGFISQGLLDASPDPMYVATLGSYKIIELVGRGGMGLVLKAYEERLNRVVALKILRPALAGDTTTLERFHREAKAAAALRHANIVTVHTVGEERGTHYIAMEYIYGPTLAELIRREAPLSSETARALFGQLLAGLAAAHAAGLIHRDIKSANILLDQRFRPGSEGDPANPASHPVDAQSTVLKIADFGLARLVTAQTRLTIPQAAFGTPEYMSPEQARGDDDISQRSDLYSAGVVLYEMLTGRTPFRADSPTVVIHRILNEDAADPRRIDKSSDPGLSSLALRLMAKRPEDRFPTAEAALEALEAGRKVGSPQRRRRRRRAFAVVLGLAVVVAAGIWLAKAAPVVAVRAAWKTNVIEARRGKSAQWEVFCELPAGTEITGVALVDAGQGFKVVVAGIVEPKPDDDKSVFAFDLEGRQLWSLDLSDYRKWPDVDSPASAAWGCTRLVAADMDGRAGEEIVVVAGHRNEYPSRISIIDPLAHKIRATFWHMGAIGPIEIRREFFDGRRPAIIAAGMNNKLDGFYGTLPGDDPPRSDWDIVSSVMILDPNEMLEQVDALGPPRTRRFDMPAARIHAYAFLNVSQNGLCAIREGARDQRPAPADECGQIDGMMVSSQRPPPDQRPCFDLVIQPAADGQGCLMTVDRNLEPYRFLATNCPPAKSATIERYWRQRWLVVIRNGTYAVPPSEAGTDNQAGSSAGPVAPGSP